MPVSLDDNFQFSYQRLLFFLSRPGEKGYIFCRADDYRFISKITTDVIRDLAQKNIHVAQLFLQKNTDEPILHQIEAAAKNAGALIVANLYDIVDTTETGLGHLTQLNFAREALWRINKPIVFWADAQSMNIIANHAPDLYSQRRHTTIHFTGVVDGHMANKLQKDGWEKFLSSKEFEDIETNVNILEKRLQGAESNNYPENRIITEIALPLAKYYAQFDAPAAHELIAKYDVALKNTDDTGVLQQLGEVYYLLHDYDRAIQTLYTANGLMESKYAEEQLPLEWYNNLIDIANWSVKRGKPNDVIPLLKGAVHLLEKNNNIWKNRTLMIMQDSLGDIMDKSGKLNAAKEYYEQVLSIAEHLNKSSQYSEQAQRDLSISYEKLGNIMAKLGDLKEAKQYYEQALSIDKQLSDNNPYSEQSQGDLSISYLKLGDVMSEMGDLNEAKLYHEQGLKIIEELKKRNPYSEELQRGLSIQFERLGCIAEKMGDLNEAEKYHKQALKIREQLSSNNPYSEELQRDLSICYNNLGDIMDKMGNIKEAQQYYEQTLNIVKQLSSNNPHSEELQRDLGIYYARIATLSQKERKTDIALQYYNYGLEILKRLSSANPLYQQLKNDIAWIEGKIKELKS